MWERAAASTADAADAEEVERKERKAGAAASVIFSFLSASRRFFIFVPEKQMRAEGRGGVVDAGTIESVCVRREGARAIRTGARTKLVPSGRRTKGRRV